MVQGTIRRPAITANNFEIKPAMIQNNLQFRGTMTGDPNQHLKWFLQLCDTFKYNGVTNDAIHNAFSWLDSQVPGFITKWDELVGKFLQMFFPISKVVQLRREIAMFKQLEGEKKIGTNIASNAENNPRREENEHVKAITLCLSKVLSAQKP
ncbi:oligopeptide transporter 4-like [Gossypium australe]|uniref:Oligopeptide transporter 4-like n=1 Tax=Gossypium australe TaxID=47621 RepID=A0A5B6VYA1_9ROSI|nr:oligopeptide transporter 4-like [Gossypium australe]